MGMWTLGVKGGRGWALEGGFLGGGGSKASGRGPFTSGRNKPGPMHPELKFTL